MRAVFNEDIHTFDFPDGITITFEKLREEKTGLTAKGIYYLNRGRDDFDVLDSGNINFDASPTRKLKRKHCSENTVQSLSTNGTIDY